MLILFILFSSDYSIVEIKIRIIYPEICAESVCCKQAFDNCIQNQFTTFISSLRLELKFDDGTYRDLVLYICENPTCMSSFITTTRKTPTGKKYLSFTSVCCRSQHKLDIFLNHKL